MGTKISSLPSAGTLTGTEIVVMDQAGNTVTAPSGNMGIWVRTAAETAAGVTPTNYAYAPGAIERYGVTASSSAATNVTAINAALSCNAEVYSAFGRQTSYPVDAVLIVPANCRIRDMSLTGTQNLAAYTPFGTSWQGQLICLTGSNSACENVEVNGATYYCGGVVSLSTTNVAVRNCYFHSSTSYNGTSNVNTPSQSILMTSVTGMVIEGNYCYDAQHGVQHWQCVDGVIGNNVCDVMIGSGVWGTSSTNLTISENTITNCGDVGLDMESGQNCVTSGNTVSSCNNGELSWFAGALGQQPTNCLFTGNACYRTATYLRMVSGTPTATACNTAGGALFISSVYVGTGGQIGIAFTGNLFQNTFATSYALYTNAVTTAAEQSGITIVGNEFVSNGALFNIQQCWGLIVKNNTFYGQPGAESVDNIWKNCSGGIWDGNQHYFANARTANYALHYYGDSTLISGATNPIVSGNRFWNCGTLAFSHDPYQTNLQAILTGNEFSLSGLGSGAVAYSSNGGVDSPVSSPLFRGQSLYLQCTGTASASIDLGTLPALAGAVGTGTLMCVNAAALGASYTFVFSINGPTVASLNGTGSGTGVPTSTTNYASFSGGTITVTGVTGDTVLGNIRLVADTWT